jgi:hypothetical protein
MPQVVPADRLQSVTVARAWHCMGTWERLRLRSALPKARAPGAGGSGAFDDDDDYNYVIGRESLVLVEQAGWAF